MPQKHDIGRQKRARAHPPLPPQKLRWLRLKARHPGPIPWYMVTFKDWSENGRKSR